MTVILKDTDRGNEREFDTVEEAKDRKQELIAVGANKDDLEIVEEDTDEQTNAEPTERVAQTHSVETVESADESANPTATDSQPSEQLPDDGPSVDEDPLVWMPDEFTDTIQGTVAINRKGFEVLAHHYDIQCDTEHVVLPSETDYEYAVVKATAIDADGDTYGAYGEADISESDMDRPELLRYADTRAYKRAISRATGVGMVAVEELQAGGKP